MAELCQGRIVWTIVPDERGHNAYPRPVVLLTRTDEIAAADELVGVVVSHTAAQQRPRPDEYIEIPYHPQGLVRTKLKKPTVAVCTWLAVVDKNTLSEDQIGGVVPPLVLDAIINKVRALHGHGGTP